MVVREKVFKIEVLIWLENATLRLAFGNTVFQKRGMLQICYAEYTESILYILSYPESTLGPPWLSQKISSENYASQHNFLKTSFYDWFLRLQ